MPTPTEKRISELTINDVADYLRLSELSEDDTRLIPTILKASKEYVLKYTGLELLQADNCIDLTIAVLVLCQDMYDTRAYYVDTNNTNKVVEAILGLHSVNLL